MEVKKVPEEPKTKPGDLYILGDHRLRWEKFSGKKAELRHDQPLEQSRNRS